MGCLGRRWRFQCTAVECGIHNLAIGLDLGAFAVEDTHGFTLSDRQSLGWGWKNKSVNDGGGGGGVCADSMLQMQVGCLDL